VGVKLVSAPATYPLSLVEAKAHLRVDDDDDDVLIELFLKAATESAEKFLGRALIDQTWDLYLAEFPDTQIRIPLPPTIEIIGVFYRDSSGVEQEFAASSYEISNAGEDTFVELSASGSWPTTDVASNAVRVRFRAGYLDGSSPPVSNVPFSIKAGILLTLGSLYAHRETVVIGQTAVQLPWGVEQLLRPHRVALGMA
jgi:uncharacterized phiE125 gp8 family phage protein